VEYDRCRNIHNDLCESIGKKVDYQLKGVENKIKGIEKATVLQATELNRRLDILNHHQAELKSFQDQFVRQDRYEDRLKNIDLWIGSAKKDLQNLVGAHEKRITKANWVAIFAVIISAVSVIFHFFYKMG
jgi:hypothetical protein